MSDAIQVRLGTAVAVLYVAAISLVGVEVVALLLESTLILPTLAPLAPLIIFALGAFALLRRRRIRRSAGATVALDHVARGARVRTRTPSRAPRNGPAADLVSRHP
ncbi:MAG TPA: hypothetical protein VGM38_08640 [Pseudolysinimonas sp.]|jgi:hypothetical protein